MLWKNIEIFNAESLTEFEDGVSWLRIPQNAYEVLEKPSGKQMAVNTTGVELRFVPKGESVKIIMSSMEDASSINTFHVYRGGLQGGWEDHELNCLIPTTPTEFTFKTSANLAAHRQIHEVTGMDWDAEVIRVIFDRGQVKLHDVIGQVAPPTPAQTPKRTLLCYGSSITHGSNSIDTSHTWASVLAHNLNMDLRNLGFAGSCAMEPELVEYIAALGEQDKWQVANLELGINVRHWEEPMIYERLENTLRQIAGRNPHKPVFVISPFFYGEELLKGCPRGAVWRRIMPQVVQKLNYPNVTYIDGLSLLGDISGMSGDLIHPNIYGVQQIADRLTAIYRQTLHV